MSESTQEVRELRWRIKQLNKQVGSQGDTIHRLRGELAEVRQLNSKIERGEIRYLQRQIVGLNLALTRQAQLLEELRQGVDDQQIDYRLSSSADLVQPAP